jgi:predicted transcriptional regulator
MKLRVKENEKLVRDSTNMAILNTDPDAVKRHEQKMAQLRKAKQQEEEINNLRQEISDIKSMMQELIKRL